MLRRQVRSPHSINQVDDQFDIGSGFGDTDSGAAGRIEKNPSQATLCNGILVIPPDVWYLALVIVPRNHSEPVLQAKTPTFSECALLDKAISVTCS